MNWACALGVLPFFALGAVGKIIAINGVAFHLFFADSRNFKAYDVAVNVCIAAYYNCGVYPRPVVHALSAGASLCFLGNYCFLGRGLAKQACHVLLVQWPLLAALAAARSAPGP